MKQMGRFPTCFDASLSSETFLVGLSLLLRIKQRALRHTSATSSLFRSGSGGLHRQGEVKRRPFSNDRLRPNSTTVPLNNALHGGQADPRASELLLAVQPLKRREEFVGKLLVK